jgi:hypothetical protein
MSAMLMNRKSKLMFTILALLAIGGEAQSQMPLSHVAQSLPASNRDRTYEFAWNLGCRRVDALGAFFRANSNTALPVIFADDSTSAKRCRDRSPRGREQATGGQHPAPSTQHPAPSTQHPAPEATLARGSLHECMEGVAKRVSDLTDAQIALRGAKDWQFPVSAPTVALLPAHVFEPFGTEPDGTMLSDHVGYSVQYHFVRRA